MFSTNFIVEAIEITLDYNLTTFNGSMYSQKKGTAMGPSNACDYADVSLSELNDLIHSDELSTVHKQCKPVMFERFRDDIFVLWLDSRENLENFGQFLNSFNPDLKFTMTTPTNLGVEFLDVWLYFKDGLLQTKPYSKPCDNHQYLSPISCHPTHTIKNIPYGIAYRLVKLTSEHSEYIKSKDEFSNYLKTRGYSKNCIEEAFNKVEKLDRINLYNSNRNLDLEIDINNETHDIKNHARNYPFVCDFNPDLPPVGKFISKHKYLLKLDPKTCKVINPDNVFVSYRGNKTIKDLLVSSKLKNENIVESNNNKVGCFKCDKKCKVCEKFMTCPEYITSYHTEKRFNFKHYLNCEVRFVLYIINDTVCKRSYVGSTENTFRGRWANHKSHIRKVLATCEISKHFKDDNFNHNFDKKCKLDIFDDNLSKHLEVYIIDCMPVGTPTAKLKEKEAYWQNQLKTYAEFGGLNKRDPRTEKSSKSYLNQT